MGKHSSHLLRCNFVPAALPQVTQPELVRQQRAQDNCHRKHMGTKGPWDICASAPHTADPEGFFFMHDQTVKYPRTCNQYRNSDISNVLEVSQITV